MNIHGARSPWWRWPVLACATGGFSSYLVSRGGERERGAATLGTLVGFACLPLLPVQRWSWLVVLVCATAAAAVIIHCAQQWLSVPDDPRIVLDEIVGGWAAVAWLPRTWPYVVAAFLLFRLFDIWKPGVIRAVQAWPGSWGILADDLLAGLLTNFLLQGVAAIMRGMA